MKAFIPSLCLAFLAIAVPAHAQTVMCDLIVKGRTSAETGYAVKADAKTLFFSGNESGKGARGYPFTSIEKLTFREPADWSPALEAEAAGEFAKAADLFDGIATLYRNIDTIVDNYGSLARLHQLECYRKLGKYADVEKKRLLLKKEGLSERYHSLLDLYVGWGALTRIDAPEGVAQLDRLMRSYREKELPAKQLAQAAYLSGIANERLQKTSEALSDYHRAFTLNFGSDKELAKMAMDAALKLYASDTRIEKDRRRLKEAHGLASICKDLFGAVPTEAERFTEPLPPEPESDNS